LTPRGVEIFYEVIAGSISRPPASARLTRPALSLVGEKPAMILRYSDPRIPKPNPNAVIPPAATGTPGASSTVANPVLRATFAPRSG
jgi:hypothetical protein